LSVPKIKLAENLRTGIVFTWDVQVAKTVLVGVRVDGYVVPRSGSHLAPAVHLDRMGLEEGPSAIKEVQRVHLGVYAPGQLKAGRIGIRVLGEGERRQGEHEEDYGNIPQDRSSVVALPYL
jgi:hypothetical protein